MTNKPSLSNRFAYLLSIALLTSLVGACRGQAVETPTAPPSSNGIPSTAPSPPQTTITFACADYDQSRYEKWAEQFHEQNPAIAVRIVASEAVYGGHADDLQALASAADSFLLQKSLEPEDIQSGLLRDLQPFLESDAAFHPEDLYPGLLDRLRWQGQLWGLPAPGMPLLLFYDKAAFDQAGLPYPQPGWSFDELETAARAMTRGQGAETVRYGLVVSPHSLAAPILVLGRAEGWAEGVSTLPEPILDAPAVVEAAQWFVDLADEGAMPNPYELQDGTTPFIVREVEEGRAAMWDGWPNAYMREAYEKVYDLGVAPFPEGVPVSNWVGGGVYAMSAGTAHPDEVWQWLRFLTYQEGDVQEVRPPVRRSVAERSGYWEKLGAELSAVVRYIMERPKVTLPPGMVGSLQTALKAALLDDQGVEKSLAQAQRELTEVLGLPISQASPPPVPTPGLAATSIVRYCSLVPPEHYQSLAQAFRKLYPEITVRVVEYSEAQSLEDLATNCDCFDFPFFWRSWRPGEQDRILNLQPFVDADPDFPDDFYPGLLDTGRWGGELWAVPAYVDFRVMRYNKNLFDQAGVAYPQPGWTPDDFWQKAIVLTESEDKVYGYLADGFMGEFFDLDFFVEQRGGFGEYEETETRTQLAPLNAAEAEDAVRWYADLMLTHGVRPPLPIEADLLQRHELVAAGRVAMWTEWQSTSYPALKFPVGTAPLPLENGPMRQQYIIERMISAQTPQPDACWKWIRFLLDQPVAATMGSPVRQSSLENPQFVGEMEEDELATIRFSMKHMDSVAWRFNIALHQAFGSIMQGTPVETAVEEALRQDEAARVCLASVSGPLTDEDIAACLEKVGLAPFP